MVEHSSSLRSTDFSVAPLGKLLATTQRCLICCFLEELVFGKCVWLEIGVGQNKDASSVSKNISDSLQFYLLLMFASCSRNGSHVHPPGGRLSTPLVTPAMQRRGRRVGGANEGREQKGRGGFTPPAHVGVCFHLRESSECSWLSPPASRCPRRGHRHVKLAAVNLWLK